jgi:uncharacterized protein (UPF0276 family)
MKFAVNYCRLALELFIEDQIQFDCFKCHSPSREPIAAVQKRHPVYVHFRFVAGRGINDAFDPSTDQAADWGVVEALLAQTGTPHVSMHLGPNTQAFPDIPPETMDPLHVDMVSEQVIRDVNPVVERFGPDRVVVENVWGLRGRSFLRPAFLPELVRRVVEETGCGLLLDLAHARLAAHGLNMNVREYIEALPTEAVREMHVSGVQRFEGRWIGLARQFGIDADVIRHFKGTLIDHMPMTGEDWKLLIWSMEEIRSGAWGRPRFVSFEYGIDEGLRASFSKADVLVEQVPRLNALVQKIKLPIG